MLETNHSQKRIVIKVGTNLLMGCADCLDHAYIKELVSQIAGLHREGYLLTLVSSGACAAGREKLGKVKGMAEVAVRQVYASIGQSRLMNIYEQYFSPEGITVAQALLTKSDLSDRSGYLNARNTLMALGHLGAICIVNENDVVAIDEIQQAKFGDNDNLSAMVANLVDADLLLILSDVNGLYTCDPLVYPDKAELISTVASVDSGIMRLAVPSHSKAATGGMITKLQAAKLAMESGIDAVIAYGREPDVITRIAHGQRIGTLFRAPKSRKESRQRWLVSGLSTRGALLLDEGAAEAVRHQNRSLLAAGLKRVDGRFKRGDAVNILDSEGNRLGCGLSNYSSDDLQLIKGMHSSKISGILGYSFGTEIIHRNNMVIL